MKKNIISIIVLILVIGQVNAMQTYSFTGLPPGSYAETCRNITIKIEGDGFDLTRVITAECQDIRGRWKKTSIKIPVINSDSQDITLENLDGALKIVR